MDAFGLTGNIGCGKSTVAKLLDRFDEVVVSDTDQMAKEFLVDAQYRRRVEAATGVVMTGTDIDDFAAVARVIFSDPARKRQLEQVIHPLVWGRLQRSIQDGAPGSIHVAESALLYELGWTDRFAGPIVVACGASEQYRRLRELRGMSDADIRRRRAAQLPAAHKERTAWAVINTECSLDELTHRVTDLYHRLLSTVSG
jgi:dephospho-CoA kinase